MAGVPDVLLEGEGLRGAAPAGSGLRLPSSAAPLAATSAASTARTAWRRLTLCCGCSGCPLRAGSDSRRELSDIVLLLLKRPSFGGLCRWPDYSCCEQKPGETHREASTKAQCRIPPDRR